MTPARVQKRRTWPRQYQNTDLQNDPTPGPRE